jgi:hypothetical protein
MAAIVRPALMPGTSISEYITRAATSDSTGAIKTAAAIPIQFERGQNLYATRLWRMSATSMPRMKLGR